MKQFFVLYESACDWSLGFITEHGTHKPLIVGSNPTRCQFLFLTLLQLYQFCHPVLSWWGKDIDATVPLSGNITTVPQV